MNKSMEARNYEVCVGRLGKTFLLLACRAGSYKESHHGEGGMTGEGTWRLSCKRQRALLAKAWGQHLMVGSAQGGFEILLCFSLAP